MKKITKILFMVLVLGFLAAGSIVPNQAMAVNDDLPQYSTEDGECNGDIIMEQNGDSNDGASGDPDSLGGGYGFMGECFGGALADLIEGGIITMEEYLCILMEQMIYFD